MTRLDLDAIRRDYPLPGVVGAVAKLKPVGNEWKACCPFHSERTASFTIFGEGKRFQCFGCGAGGDVLDFVQALHRVDLKGAAALLGAGELPVAKVSQQTAVKPECDDRLAEALAIWRAAGPVEGTPAERYLRHRGITIPAPLSLRYAVLPYGRRGPLHPCLVACVSSPEGPLQGLQRVFLADDGRGKLDVPAPKLSLGRVSGGAIRLGPLDDGELVVCSGVEDGLSLMQELGRPVWAAPGDTMLPAMRFPATVRRVAIGGDNDRSGHDAAHKAARTYSESGLATRIFFPAQPHKDFNSQLTGGRT